MERNDLKNTVIFILLYLGIYFLVMIMISQPWRFKLLWSRTQRELDRVRGALPPLSGKQEIMVREFLREISVWEHRNASEG